MGYQVAYNGTLDLPNGLHLSMPHTGRITLLFESQWMAQVKPFPASHPPPLPPLPTPYQEGGTNMLYTLIFVRGGQLEIFFMVNSQATTFL